MNMCEKKKNEPVILVHRSSNPESELYHYGVKGMKWGVRRAAKLGLMAYKGVKQHGQNTLENKAARNDFRSQYHAERGHKLRSEYYDKQAFKNRDKKFDDHDAIMTGIKDIGLKSETVRYAATVGMVIVKRMFT